MTSKQSKKSEQKTDQATSDLSIGAEQAAQVKGGAPMKADGSLDAGVHFKYDIKAQKEG